MSARALSICALLIAAYATWVISLPVEIRTEQPVLTATSVASSFFQLQDATVWPVPEAPPADLSSTFGPRIRQSTGAYDFHRGVDIHAAPGTPVVAAYPGTLYGIRTFQSGGLTVILEHDLPTPVNFHGQQVNRFFTLHMHLSEVASSLQDAADLDLVLDVPAGSTIGAVGTSGATVTPHLHFEVRLGSQCSLEFQIDNPDNDCFGLNADPHVHPLLLFPPQQLDVELRMVAPLTDLSPGVFEVSTSDDRPLIGTYVLDTISNGQVVERHTLDLNTRRGFDPSTNENLDRPEITVPYLVPLPFTFEADEWSIRYLVPEGSVTPPDETHSLRLTVIDIWGRSTALIIGR